MKITLKTSLPRGILPAAAMVVASSTAWAGGPLNLNPNDPDGVERWPNGGANIPFNLDAPPAEGDLALGPLTYDEAVRETLAALARWEAIPHATQTYQNNGPLEEDIDATNFAPFVQNLFFGTNTADGLSPVVFDADGSIFVALFGSSGVLGFASPDTRAADGTPIEAVCFLNGGSMFAPIEFPVQDFIGVITHEFGHYSGLAHTVVNGQNIRQDDTTGPSPNNTYGDAPTNQIETMFPFATIDGEQDTPHADDIAIMSFLYPSDTFFAESGSITGRVLDLTGTVALTGVNVVARNIADPFGDAVSSISGDRGTTGVYTINGLTPGGQYTVHIDQLISIPSYSTPGIQLSGPEEFYNGANESNDVSSPDNPAESVPVGVAAGAPTTGIDFILNFGLGDDTSTQVGLPFPFTICGRSFDSAFVNSNGSVTFGAGDAFFVESAAGHLGGPPRIAALWDDLNPSLGGKVRLEEAADSFSVVFEGVPEFPAEGANSFTITLFDARGDDDDDDDDDDDGRRGNRFTVSYGNLSAPDGLAGFSCGGGITSGLEREIDLSALGEKRIRTAGNAAVYEQFSFGEAPNDLANSTLRYGETRAFRDPFEPNDIARKAARVRLPFTSIDRFSALELTGGDVDWYTFRAKAKSTVVAEVIAGQLDSAIGLFRVISDDDDDDDDPVEVVELAVDDDSGKGTLSQIVFPIEESGRYALAVSTADDIDFSGDGSSGGRYVLDIQTLDGTRIDIGDDDSVEVKLGFAFPFQNASWDSVFVNSNGNLTFGEGDTSLVESAANLLAGPPRIAALWDDLAPNNGGAVFVRSDDTSLLVTFLNVPEFSVTGVNTFSIRLEHTGEVTVSYGALTAIDGLAGVTEGGGAEDPGPTDLSASAALSAAGTTYETFDPTSRNDLEASVLTYASP